MSAILYYINLFNNELEKYANQININPKSYVVIFPPKVDKSRISDMVKEGLFPTIAGLAPAITVFLFLSISRFILQKILLKPFALRCMTLKYNKYDKNEIIEKSFPINKKIIKDEEILHFSQTHGIKVSIVTKYLRNRKNNEIIDKKVVKFIEALWRFCFFLIFTLVGIRVLIYPNKAIWISDEYYLWNEWPYHETTSIMKIYYHIELGSYLHQLLWTESTRSDAVEMLIHHFVTLSLIFASYLTNFTRLGTYIMLIHDPADIFLELAKVMNYTSQGKGHRWLKLYTDIVFGIFAIVFFITRLVIYPRYIVYGLYYHAVPIYGLDFIGAYIWIFLLCSLQVLHIFWFYLILRMVYRLITTGVEKDERSEDEELIEDVDDDNTVNKKNI